MAKRLRAVHQPVESGAVFSLAKTAKPNMFEFEWDDQTDPVERFLYDTKKGWCEHFAGAMTLMCQSLGIPARLGYADVRNHLNSAALLELMDTDLFVFHGWSAVYVDGQWRKGSPAFNSELCRRFGVEPLEFDGSKDALLHEVDGAGRRHMEYVRERGMFVDLPFDELMATLLDTYGPAMVRGSDTPRPQDPRFGA